MLKWLARCVSSSIGKKALTALSGLALVGFLIGHALGNLTLYSDSTGEVFNAYAQKLEDTQPLLGLVEIGLLLVFAVHIGLALRVSRENQAARGTPYQVRSSMGERTLASGSMLITGSIVLVFLVVHVADFRIPRLLGSEDMHDLAAAVKARLASPLGAGVYLVGVVALGIHLSHAIRSAFQTLGVNHPKYTPLIAKVGLALAVVLGLAFASFPIVLFLQGASQ